jgi:putative toxin-antitoxin system antitoxin component (TIGR02293 family)
MASKKTVNTTRPSTEKFSTKLDPEKVAHLTTIATKVLGDQSLAQRWLRQPILALGGVTPLVMATQSGGMEKVEAVLGRIAYGGYS